MRRHHHQRIVLLVLLLSSYCGCESITNILRHLHDGWNINELTLVYHTYPVLPAWSYVDTPRVSLNLSWTGVNVSYLDLRFADLETHISKIYPKVTTMLALSADRLKTIMTRVLEPDRGMLVQMFRRWMLLIPVAYSGAIEEVLKGLYVPVTCQVYFVVLPPSWHKGANNEMLEAFHHGIFRYKNTTLPLMVVNVPRGVTIPFTHDGLWTRRSNLGGLTFKAGFVANQWPWIIIRNGSKIEISGHIGDVWGELRSLLNFSNTYHLSVDSKWGSLHSNGQWSGLIGMLHRREIDVAVAAMSITKNRTKVVDFTHVVCSLRYYVYFKKNAGELTLASVLLMAPWQIFVVLVASVVISTVAQLVTLWLSPEPEDWNMAHSPDVIAFNNLFAFCMQGTEWGSSMLRTPPRLVLWLTYFCGFIVFNMYSATMMSRLAVSSGALPFNNLEELVRSNIFKLIAVNGTADIEIVKTVLQEFGDTSVPKEVDDKIMPSNLSEGIERVCEGNFALLTSLQISYTDNTNQPKYSCNPAALSTPFKDTLSFAVLKGIPYLHIFNTYLQMMMELGILQRSRNKWHRKKETPLEEQESIGMHHTLPLFLWITVGFVASLFAVFVERCVFKLTRARIAKRTRRNKQLVKCNGFSH